jgi:hypothetical protein
MLAAAVWVAPHARAQPPRPPLEERVAMLELELETLAERVAARGNVAPSPLVTPDVPLYGRIDELERAIDRLSVDMQRLARDVDNAAREAAEARREAMAAERLARDAARVR